MPSLRQIWAAKPSILRDHSRIFVVGMLVQLGVLGAMFVGFGPVAKYRVGVIESERVTPASHSGLLVGRVACDVVVLPQDRHPVPSSRISLTCNSIDR